MLPLARRLRISLLLLLGLALLVGNPVAWADADRDFLSAREAYGKGRGAEFERLSARIPSDYPLQTYLHYWRLKRSSASAPEMIEFIRLYPDSPLSERMRLDLVRLYGKAEDWGNFSRWSDTLRKRDTEITCLDLQYRMMRFDAKVEEEGRALYQTGQDLPSTCTTLFVRMVMRGMLGDEARLARLRLALDAGNLRLAREINANLAENLRMNEASLSSVARGAEKFITAASPADALARGEQEVVLYALTQMAKDNPARAAEIWEKTGAAFAEELRQYGWGQVAQHAARRHMPETVVWFQKAGLKLSENQLLWRARSMLRAGRWPDVYQSILAMPADMQAEAVWRYWKARALKALNAAYPANLLFAPLSQEHHYYGLLANEELPARLEARGSDYRLTAEDIRQAENHPGLQRALLLRKLGLNADATSEWEWALRGMDDHQLLAAAELARQDTWYDRAISTAEKTRQVHNFDLRYLTPFRDLAESYARQNDLDPAWVYGLMRQESRFIDYARSKVGAQGLMQIMPATAKWIGRQLGLGRQAYAQVGEPETNIRFGTYYLSKIQRDLSGSPVLATAGYNAGPGRARRWQGEDVELEGAIYVESIPYAETREYVKKVLTNAMYYSQRLGQDSGRLKDRLGTIPARKRTLPALEDVES